MAKENKNIQSLDNCSFVTKVGRWSVGNEIHIDDTIFYIMEVKLEKDWVLGDQKIVMKLEGRQIKDY